MHLFVLVSLSERFFIMSSYSKSRLEGRALEHAVSGDSCHSIRMKDDSTGVWEYVKGNEAKVIRIAMKKRAQEVLEGLRTLGVHWRRGEAVLRLEDGQERSVDMTVFHADLGEFALVEVKWSRKGCAIGRRAGQTVFLVHGWPAQ